MHHGAGVVALRSLNGRNSRRFRRLAAVGVALSLAAGLPACSSDPSWPTLGKVPDLGNVLTPEERQKAVQDMQKIGDAQANNATPAIVKSGQ